jgi:hypothetical protein
VNIPRPRHAAELRAHLRHLHGIHVEDEKTDAGLAECHASDHEQPWSHARLPHTHGGGRNG